MELLFVSITEASAFAFRDFGRCWPAIVALKCSYEDERAAVGWVAYLRSLGGFATSQSPKYLNFYRRHSAKKNVCFLVRISHLP